MSTFRISGIAILIFLLLSSCVTEEDTSTLMIVDVAALGLEKAEVTHIGQGMLYKIEKADTITLEITDDIIMDLVSGWDHHYIHITPGGETTLDTIAGTGGVISTAGELTQENEFLVRFAQLAREAPQKHSRRDLAGSEPDSFMIKLDEKYKGLDGLLVEVNDDIDMSPEFKSGMNTRLSALRGQDILGYGDYHLYLTKKEAKLPEDIYKSADLTKVPEAQLLQFNSSRGLIESWISKDIDYEELESTSAYFEAIIAATKTAYPSGALGSYLQLNAILNQVNFGAGIDGASEIVDAFQPTITSNYIKEKLADGIEPWANLRAGYDAPNFVANDRKGNSVELSELQGKRVYIDVWATWCGPCIREIPSLKTLEKELHDENIEFVSVSIDKEQDKEKWLAFIKEKDLGGTQLMAEGAWQSDVTTAYNIKGIPRFLLIDEVGKIISANAPRPSAANIKETLLN